MPVDLVVVIIRNAEQQRDGDNDASSVTVATANNRDDDVGESAAVILGVDVDDFVLPWQVYLGQLTLGDAVSSTGYEMDGNGFHSGELGWYTLSVPTTGWVRD